MFFPAILYGCESWTVKKAECQRIDAFELWCWRRLLIVPWIARRSNQSILRTLNTHCWRIDAEAEALVFWSSHVNGQLIGKVPVAGKDWGQKKKRVSEHEMAGQHHWYNECELGQIPGDGEGQGSVACCSSWGCKQLDMTGWLNNQKGKRDRDL